MRTPADMLRAGSDEGRVSGLFDIASQATLKAVADVVDAPIDADGGELLLTRRVFSSGRSSLSLNGNPITLAMLKQIAELLVDVHGQHDQQFLLRPANQLDVLDTYAKLDPAVAAYREIFSKLQSIKARIAELDATRTLRRQQLDLYQFQADEIDKAELSPGEFEELQARSSILGNLEKLKKEISGAYGVLYESDNALLERLKMMAAIFIELSDIDSNLKPIATTLRDATLQLEDVAFDIGRYLNRLDLDPGELAEVADRLNVINRVLNKYGDPVATTIAYREEIGAKIEQLKSAGADDTSLANEIPPLQKKLLELGRELSKKRVAAARILSTKIGEQLAELGMERATFTIDVKSIEATPNAHGLDAVEFIIQTNPGLPPQPLRKIASGGEMSRIMLALKGTLAQGDRVSVLVFDEIDSNVGGRLGAIIGGKLRALAGHHQVLCITHLPQIAAYASRHLTVRKESSGAETRTSVRAVDGADRLNELAEMIGGQRITNTTLAQAQELLDAAAEVGDSSRAMPKRARKIKANS